MERVINCRVEETDADVKKDARKVIRTAEETKRCLIYNTIQLFFHPKYVTI